MKTTCLTCNKVLRKGLRRTNNIFRKVFAWKVKRAVYFCNNKCLRLSLVKTQKKVVK